MRKLILTCLAASAFIAASKAQTLFTYGNNPVSKEEFLRVYEKNSLNKRPDFSDTALRSYLDLYSLFRMKVREAELQRLDTLPSIQNELNNYRRQLAKNYLTDDDVTNKLMHEAYDRMKEEIHVAHIMVLQSPNALPKDTAAAYKKIDSIYNAVTKNKADFATMAKNFSDDRGSRDLGGDIGYITALQTVYPFENEAYNTPVGKVSKPFRTQFGYHILKVLDKRPARGEVKVAQILITTPPSKGEAGVEAARKRVDSVENDLKHGMSFEDAVKKYSDDKFTVNDGGVMPTFGVGKMVPAFESAAYALKNPGDISAPIKTEYGFHIIKLIAKYPIKPFDSLQAMMKRKVDADSRSQVAKDIYMAKVREKNGFKEYPKSLDEIAQRFAQIPDTGKNANAFKLEDFSDLHKPLFALAGKEYSQQDFLSYAQGVTRGHIMGPKAGVARDLYNMYVNSVVNDLQEHQLADEKPEFRNLMEEYRDGIMLFELMDRNVWGKASRDTAGLKAFYETRKGKYTWEPGFEGAVYHFKDEKAMREGLKLIDKKGTTDEDLVKKLNTDATPNTVTIQRGRYEFSKFTDVPRAELVKGKASLPHKNADGTYTVVKADEIYNEPTPKSLDDAKGYAIAEYQDYLEKQWNDQMRKKYPVQVHEDVLKSMERNN